MNVDLLLKAKQKILDNPDHFHMANFLVTETCLEPDYTNKALQELRGGNPSCGTTACIGGWAIVESRTSIFNPLDMSRNAREVLELTFNQADLLFFGISWPIVFKQQFLEAKNNKERAEVAARRIDHFIATNGD